MDIKSYSTRIALGGLISLFCVGQAEGKQLCAEMLAPEPPIYEVEPVAIQQLLQSMQAVHNATTRHERNEAVLDAVSSANAVFDDLSNLNYVLSRNTNVTEVEPPGLREHLFEVRQLLQDVLGLSSINLKRVLAARTAGIRAMDHNVDPIGYIWSQDKSPSTGEAHPLANGIGYLFIPTDGPDLAENQANTTNFAPDAPKTQKLPLSHAILPIGLDHHMQDSARSETGAEKFPIGFGSKSEPFVDDNFDRFMYLDTQQGIFDSTKIVSEGEPTSASDHPQSASHADGGSTAD